MRKGRDHNGVAIDGDPALPRSPRPLTATELATLHAAIDDLRALAPLLAVAFGAGLVGLISGTAVMLWLWP